MKTKWVAAVLVLTMALGALGLTACYPSKPGTMRDLTGTYQLSAYTRSYDGETDQEGQTVAHDLIEERGVKAYLVVNGDGTGLYVYQDNNTAPSARLVHIQYTYDEDDASLVKEIVYTNGTSDSGDGYPGKGTEKLGLNFKRKTKDLTYTMPAVFGRKYSQTVRYTKVADAVDLGYVNAQLGVQLTEMEC